MSPTYRNGVEVQPTATPAVVLGTTGAQGSANTVVASDATIPAFDATNPSTQASADSPVVGVAAVAARRDHKHGMPTIGNATIAIGTYTGDGTANRGIAHGLGVAPKWVFIMDTTANGRFNRILGTQAFIFNNVFTDTPRLAVTQPDATNFYVGNAAHIADSGNVNNYTYEWMAIV